MLLVALSTIFVLKMVAMPTHKQLTGLKLPTKSDSILLYVGYTGCPNQCLSGLNRMAGLQQDLQLDSSIFVNVLDHLPPSATEQYLSHHLTVEGWSPSTEERNKLLAQLGAQIEVSANEIIHGDDIFHLSRENDTANWYLTSITPPPLIGNQSQ